MTDAPAEEGPASCAFHSAGVSARVLSAGAALHELVVRDSRGTSADVLLGFDSANGTILDSRASRSPPHLFSYNFYHFLLLVIIC